MDLAKLFSEASGQPDGIGDPGVLAPWPQIDRFPIIIGSNLSFPYISAVQRQALFGYRLQWVDLCRELVRKDPGATYANLQARILATASGRVEVVSASRRYDDTGVDKQQQRRVEAIRHAAGLPSVDYGISEDDRLLADDIASRVKQQMDALPERPQALARLLWGIYFGPTAAEIVWDRRPDEWRAKRLHFIHPRRIAYPDQNNWHPHIWDQGLVVSAGPDWQKYLTSGLFGIDIADYPNKFVVFDPQLLGGYPTEDGLGMILAFYIALKIAAVRGGGEFFERFIKPWVLGYYRTTNDDKQPRNANQTDINQGNAALQAMGLGGLSSAMLPDCLKIEMFGPGVKGGESQVNHVEWLHELDDQIARAIRTTSALQQLGKGGNRSAMEEVAKGAKLVNYYDAACLSAALTAGLSTAIVALNYPGKEHLVPTIAVHIDDEPGPEVMLERIDKAAKAGFPIDADKAAAVVGLGSLLADPNNKNVRILYPVKAIDVLPPQKPTDTDIDEDEPEGEDASDDEATAETDEAAVNADEDEGNQNEE